MSRTRGSIPEKEEKKPVKLIEERVPRMVPLNFVPDKEPNSSAKTAELTNFKKNPYSESCPQECLEGEDQSLLHHHNDSKKFLLFSHNSNMKKETLDIEKNSNINKRISKNKY